MATILVLLPCLILCVMIINEVMADDCDCLADQEHDDPSITRLPDGSLEIRNDSDRDIYWRPGPNG